jgi:hypothetical protein
VHHALLDTIARYGRQRSEAADIMIAVIRLLAPLNFEYVHKFRFRIHAIAIGTERILRCTQFIHRRTRRSNDGVFSKNTNLASRTASALPRSSTFD